jgi:membrane fusion protein (multidrug efflux system)
MGARMVSVGERVSGSSMRGPGGGGGGGGDSTGLARIDSLDPMELLFTLPETIMGLARTGVQVTLRVAPFPDETFVGEIYFIDPRINAANRRVLVKARVANPDHKLRPGMFAKLEALVAERPDALMVPEDSVMYAQEGTSVWRVDGGGMPERVAVELGIRQPGRVEITRGLRPGDRIVAAGAHKVSPGRAVRSQGEGGAPASGGADS